MSISIFKYFQTDVSSISLPERFTFPFYYDPHPLALVAAKELQDYLSVQTDFTHDFGIDGVGVGKMFGVLIVRNAENELGYIQAFSGMMSSQTVVNGFAPPVYDILDPESYFQKKTRVLALLTEAIQSLQIDPSRQSMKTQYELIESNYYQKFKEQKAKHKSDKRARKLIREEKQNNIPEEEYKFLLTRHKQESLNAQFLLQSYGEYIDQELALAKVKYLTSSIKLDALKQKRKSKSNALQQWLFDQYNFLNISGEKRNVIDIFRNRVVDVPPSGTGDCAAPKMLQYAFSNGLNPVAMAEFWWGKSPNSEVRKHGNFYSACRGKCEPVLGHMLQGIDVDPNPFLTNQALGKILETIYEDEYICVINKPTEFLSGPGKYVTDSVQERMKDKYPESTGPLIVHRLDMSTSGLLVIGKTKEIYTQLQLQFVKRTVKKRYIALLDGVVTNDEGYIDLPLQLDINNRPYQKVEYEFGKSARTRFEVIERKAGKTKIYFYPVTGRTHQLRVHAAHVDGLNAPIVGDDLYGVKGDRLHLHAESITFTHPVTGEEVTLSVEAEF
ncbi:pseudouridine synthase [Saprospiraceae bacterium]|jgi:tRNA pseudouridine32 synthase/23S rRNA pseudouridine746 synthase|nr:pseudouridine synthase [Saprospiraceae bacterium]HCV50492.1 RNA pseudouridine synthase [Saprospirales bacterium]MDA9333224.1 pseudouridine synthase [Saprospiraceae bacterium]MDA9866561.1 pseudouridine synthase [Saprospiraceae bacterium]MDB4162398.1 pseudouridine synthase [Saprospiraceae bacterium]